MLVGRLISHALSDRALRADPITESKDYLMSIVELARHSGEGPFDPAKESFISDWIGPLLSTVKDLTDVLSAVKTTPLTDDEIYKESMDYSCGLIGYYLMKIHPSREHWCRCLSDLD
jgi:hypothetical protein